MALPTPKGYVLEDCIVLSVTVDGIANEPQYQLGGGAGPPEVSK